MGMVLPEVARVLAAGINPHRITQALDLRGMDGPDVDVACGAAEPAVDEWEAGTRVPTGRQLRKLAALTGFPPAFFAKPDGPPITGGWLCIRSGRGKGCYTLDDPRLDRLDELEEPEPEQLPLIPADAVPRRPPAPPLPRPPAGELPECAGCQRPMRRDTWTRQRGRCSRCGPA